MTEYGSSKKPDLAAFSKGKRLYGVVSAEVWVWAREQLADGNRTLLGLWGETGFVHMALWDPNQGAVNVIRYACPSDGIFPAVSRVHPPANRLERAIVDLTGLKPDTPLDDRPWLDHGKWGKSGESPGSPRPYPFLLAEGDSLHQIPVGPVHAGIIEPGHFRFTASGETIVRLEERLGYVHKGIESLMAGANPAHAAKLAARTSGDSAVAYGFAFARAVENALGIEVPLRACWLRALMAELERLANHLGDIGAICNDAAFPLMHTHCGILREHVLRACDLCFSHRLMFDAIVPGGVTADIGTLEISALRTLVSNTQKRFPALIDLYDNTPSLQDRTVGTGVLKPALAQQYGVGGYIGRASNRAFDARRTPGYQPYDDLEFDVPLRKEGDVNARVWVRILEVEQSLSLIEQILDGLPKGETHIVLPRLKEQQEGFALVEGFRGDVFAWVRIGEDGNIMRAHLRDPSWFQWPLLEAIVEGNIVADFPLCNKSFNCSYSGHDL